MSVVAIRIHIEVCIRNIRVEIHCSKDHEQPVAHDKREQQREEDLMRRDRGLEEF
jgi:tmRNA-binding protein